MGHTKLSDAKRQRALSPAVRHPYDESALAMTVADQVRQLCSVLGKSQEQLARRANTTQPMIARLDRGGQPPSLRTLERLAEAMNADLTILLTARAS